MLPPNAVRAKTSMSCEGAYIAFAIMLIWSCRFPISKGENCINYAYSTASRRDQFVWEKWQNFLAISIPSLDSLELNKPELHVQ